MEIRELMLIGLYIALRDSLLPAAILKINKCRLWILIIVVVGGYIIVSSGQPLLHKIQSIDLMI
jgi:hypothetical protein